EQTADLKGIEWRSVWHCLLVTTCGVVVYGILQQTTGLRIQDDFGKEPLAAASRAGAIMTLMALSMVIAQGIVLRFLALRPNYTVCIGALVGAGALFLLVGDLTIIQFGICMAGVGFAMGLMLPANLAEMSLRTGNDSQGRIAGINGIGQGLGMVLGPTVGAALYQVSNQAPYLLSSVLFIIVFGLYILRPRAVHK
ncbi:MAG: MFS transporter, partial [Verrucomicrobiota bacterium]